MPVPTRAQYPAEFIDTLKPVPTRAKLRANFVEALNRAGYCDTVRSDASVITAAVEVVLGPADNDGLRPATARHRQNFLALADAILHPGQDAPVPAASTTDAEAKLQEIDAITRRISQLENALQVMAEFALSEIREHKARHAAQTLRNRSIQNLLAQEREVLQLSWPRKSLQFADQEKRITDLLRGLGLTSEQDQ